MADLRVEGFEACQKIMQGIFGNEKLDDGEKLNKLKAVSTMKYDPTQTGGHGSGPVRMNKLQPGGTPDLRPSA